ncbi:hypothetical protein HML84_20255 [Alcanivorax sp. IO_7]|nr:hypothetical protein HML84_20255 [Alcanivorax sp. IO_7]
MVTLTSSDLGWASKLGRISTAVFAYAATAILTASAFAFAGPVFAAIAGALLAGFLTALLSRFNERYFSKITGIEESGRFMLDWLIIVFVFLFPRCRGACLFLSWARKWPKVDVALGDMDVKNTKYKENILSPGS